MKRVFIMLVVLTIVSSTSGCSSCGPCNNNGLFQGGLVSRFDTFRTNAGNGISNIVQDGPVRRWFRGDACDTCNVPAGQISVGPTDGFNCSNGSCNPPIGENVFGAPISSVQPPTVAPITSGFPPVYTDGSSNTVGSVLPNLDLGYQDSTFLNAPTSGGGEFFGAVDSAVLPPLTN